MAAEAGSSQAHLLELLSGLQRSLREGLAGARVRFGAWPASQQLDQGLPMGYWF
ncbi:MAG: hypothetical protein ACO24U_08695 [Prochlorococcaceae cyanobacterium]|jgi:hypothetical protein